MQCLLLQDGHRIALRQSARVPHTASLEAGFELGPGDHRFMMAATRAVGQLLVMVKQA